MECGSAPAYGFLDPWPILSEDGETLVLVAATAAVDRQVLLRIYRKKDQRGVFLGSYTREDLFIRRPNEPSVAAIFDSTPQWFAEESSFSEDGSELVYRDQAHGVVRIRLTDRAVRRKTALRDGDAGGK